MYTPPRYPTRVRITDPTGEPVAPGYVAANPDPAKPHVGKEGLAELVCDPDGRDESAVRITLDDGTVLWGWECWWEPIE